MKILIIGAGAVGGYFGGRLAGAGRDVTFLVRPERAKRLTTDGLKIISPHGNMTVRPKLVLTGEIVSAYDIVLLTVKAYALEQAMEDFASAVEDHTTVVPFLNGIRHLDLLARRFGHNPLVGGVCLVATTVDGDGSIVQLDGTQSLEYGELAGEVTPRVKDLDKALQGAAFETSISSNIMQDMWEKWIFLATLGGITCLMRGTIGEIEAAPGGADLARKLLAECAAVSTASGYIPAPPFLTRVLAAVTTRGSGLTSSMYRDLTSGKPVEVDHIVGDLLDRARQLRVPTPLLETVFAHLRVYQSRYSVS
jgi:2-dehydropantoate 2-reductase